VVPAVGGLLAAGAIGADSISDCVADPAAVPDRRNRGWWSFRIAARDHVPARAGAPGAPDGIG
jgi:hypothetical protein